MMKKFALSITISFFILLSAGTQPVHSQGPPVDFAGLPQDLSTSALAIRQVTAQQYYSWVNINRTLNKNFKKYPFTWSLIAPVQYPTPKELLDAGYKYELVFQKVALTYHRQNSGGVTDTQMKEKDLFWVMVRDVRSGKTYSTQRSPVEYPYAFKDFIKSVKKGFKSK